MTIAIGVLATNGVVIAADREENDGYLKNDTGKIVTTFKGRAPVGSIVIAGSGTGPYVDEISKLITDAFVESEVGTETAIRSRIVAEHRRYYTECVLPFSAQPQNERPDYSLLIGCYGDDLGYKLWRTVGLAVNEESPFAAVGWGASSAQALLGRLYERLPLDYAIKLAAFVIFMVNRSSTNCGFGTNISVARRDIFNVISRRLIREWESLFESYLSLERSFFYHCLGLNIDERQLLRQTRSSRDSMLADVDEFRRLLARLEMPPTPSVPQTLPDQQ